MARKKLTVYDYLKCKGKRQLSVLFVHNAEEALAAEEAGIDIDEKLLIHTAHWTTPPKQPRRFCTWFFIYPLTALVNVTVDNDEILDHRWISPSDALAEEEAENIVIPKPTSTTLRDIANHRNLNDLITDVTASNIRVFPKDSAYYRPEEMGVSTN